MSGPTYAHGTIKMTQAEYELINKLTNLEENISDWEYRNGELLLYGKIYSRSFIDTFLNTVIENISICEVSIIQIEEDLLTYSGVYYIYPGKYEWQEFVPKDYSEEFQHHIDTYKYIKKTKNNLDDVAENKKFNI